MLKYFVLFLINSIQQYLTGHYYRRELIAIDSKHPHYRRYSDQYKKKRQLIKSYWITASLITLLFPFVEVAAVLCIISALSSLCTLDESEE